MSNFPGYKPSVGIQAQCPEVNSKAKDMVNCRFTLQPFRKQLRTIFRIIVSVNQLQSLRSSCGDV